MSAQPLADRIWNAIPVTEPAFAKLLGLLDVEASEAVATAAVTLGTPSRLLVNPGFVAHHCRSDAALAMLVMHELMHVLLGHTRLFERLTPAQNWAFDAVINADLCRRFRGPEHTRLFRVCYDAGVFPEALLRPPEGWSGGEARWRLDGEAGRVHRALYETDTGVTYAELFRLLERMGEGCVGGDGVERLLGSHGDSGDAVPASGDPDVLRAVRDILAEWPMVERLSGRDQGGEHGERSFSPARARREAVAVLRRAVLPLLDLGAGFNGLPRASVGTVDAVVPYRSGRDRRAAVTAAAGLEPLFDTASLSSRTLERRDRAHVYLDVSGSMDDVLPVLYGALRPVLPWLAERVHLFSTMVADVPASAIRNGVVTTTGGTAIGCVTAHMLEHRVRRAVVVTDGWVGNVSARDADALRRRGARVNTVVTARGEETFATAFRGRCYRLPALAPGE